MADRCRHCDHRLGSTDRFCAQCGQPVTRAEPASVPPSPQPREDPPAAPPLLIDLGARPEDDPDASALVTKDSPIGPRGKLGLAALGIIAAVAVVLAASGDDDPPPAEDAVATSTTVPATTTTLPTITTSAAPTATTQPPDRYVNDTPQPFGDPGIGLLLVGLDRDAVTQADLQTGLITERPLRDLNGNEVSLPSPSSSLFIAGRWVLLDRGAGSEVVTVRAVDARTGLVEELFTIDVEPDEGMWLPRQDGDADHLWVVVYNTLDNGPSTDRAERYQWNGTIDAMVDPGDLGVSFVSSGTIYLNSGYGAGDHWRYDVATEQVTRIEGTVVDSAGGTDVRYSCSADLRCGPEVWHEGVRSSTDVGLYDLGGGVHISTNGQVIVGHNYGQAGGINFTITRLDGSNVRVADIVGAPYASTLTFDGKWLLVPGHSTGDFSLIFTLTGDVYSIDGFARSGDFGDFEMPAQLISATR